MNDPINLETARTWHAPVIDVLPVAESEIGISFALDAFTQS